MRTQKSFLTLLVICLTLLLVATPILSKEKDRGGGGNGNGNGNGRGSGQVHEPAAPDHQPQNNSQGNRPEQRQGDPSTPPPTSGDLLGCQKNNPDRLDCSSLEVGGYCDGTTAVFTIRNTGEPGNGDMRAPTSYRLIVDGSVVESGSVQLAGGATMEIRYSGGGTVTLEADQQVGHPGNSRPRVTLACSAPTSTPEATPEPTQEPTSEVTPEPTPDVMPDPFALTGDAYCLPDRVVFNVVNLGGAMPDPLGYNIFNAAWIIIGQGSLQLGAGETLSIEADLSARVLNVGEGLLVLYVECYPQTPEPTSEVTPDPYNLIADSFCTTDGLAVFTVTNTGGAMVDPLPYRIVSSDGTLIEEGTLLLQSGQTITLGGAPGTLILNVDNGLLIHIAACGSIPTPEVTPEPTSEVTPEPTQEVTPEPTPEVTPEPTSEVTPEPTPEVTPTLPPLNCARNNEGRLDCSSLEVTATCDGGTAVFTIHNTGEPGNGDMRAPTEYRLLVDGVVVSTGLVDLDGGATMEVRYDGAGTITLEADQQIGHPGKSQPQATISCG